MNKYCALLSLAIGYVLLSNFANAKSVRNDKIAFLKEKILTGKEKILSDKERIREDMLMLEKVSILFSFNYLTLSKH